MNLALSALLVFFVASAAAQYQNPFARQFFPKRTTTISSTSTLTITCTKSVAQGCPAGRRRRGVIEDSDDIQNQYPISPSAVHGVEPTPLRESRAADPQLLLVNPAYDYPLQSGIYSGNYRPVAVPFLEGYGQADVAERLNFMTITSYSATLTVTTTTVTPACSAAGTSLQCPNA